MYKFSLTLLIPILMFASCSGSDGLRPEPPVVNPGLPDPEVSLTTDNLKGSWETYHFVKKIETAKTPTLEMRYSELDGSTINFLDENNYYETNARGDEVLKGTYKILGKGQVEFSYKDTADRDVDVIKNFIHLGKRKLTSQTIYGADTAGVKINVTDTKMYRNLRVAPGITDGVLKEKVDVARLKGSWEMIRFTKRLNNISQVVDSLVGTSYTFVAKNDPLYDGTYEERDPDGRLSSSGSFLIIDDVVHFFFLEEDGEHTSTFWIHNWAEKNDGGVKREGYQVYDRYIHINKQGRPGTYESIAEIRRKK